MDDATRLFKEARDVASGGTFVDVERRKFERREKILLAIGGWYAQLQYVVPRAMKAESKTFRSDLDGNEGRYRADFLGAEFTARVESEVVFRLSDGDERVSVVPVAPEGYDLPALEPGKLLLYVFIFPYGNLFTQSKSSEASASAACTYTIDERGTLSLTVDDIHAALTNATAQAALN